MKALKLLLLTLFAALGLAAQAQTIEFYKDGQVIDSFSAAQVDSVVYKQVAATPKYYYYVGTEEPTADNFGSLKIETTKDEWNNKEVEFPKGIPYFAFPKEWNYVMKDANGFNCTFDETTFIYNGIVYIKFKTNKTLKPLKYYITAN